MSPRRVAVIGAGWSGATVARVLHDAGIAVEVFEAAGAVGGHSRVERLGGVVYEPNGAHIFHTSDREVAAFVQRFGMSRPYEHRVVTEVFLPDDGGRVLLSWPPQLEELRELPMWPAIAHELERRPAVAGGANFEERVIQLMGATLYSLLVRDYTIKQWGRDPTELSSSIAPKRVELRSDGYRRLFRDRWEYFESEGVNAVVENVLEPVPVTCRTELSLADLDHLDAAVDHVVVTAPLDQFAGDPGTLEWRGISMRSRHLPMASEEATATEAYVVNRPSPTVPYTRTVETKHASGQRIAATVVSEEHPGADRRHYPVPTPEGRNEAANRDLQDRIRCDAPRPVSFCGRLANYTYIDQDQAIRQGIDLARRLLDA